MKNKNKNADQFNNLYEQYHKRIENLIKHTKTKNVKLIMVWMWEKDILADDITDITLTQAGYFWNAEYNEIDFTCKIKGENDVLYMREKRHDDGYGIVVRSVKDDIWERIILSEAFKLEDKL